MRKQPKEKPLKTVEDLYEEQNLKMQIYWDLMRKLPGKSLHKDYKLLKRKFVKTGRILKLIEDHLL